MTIYLFSTKWRGSLHVEPMRSFTTYEKLLEHIRSSERLMGELHSGCVSIYEMQLDSDTPPKSIKTKVHKELCRG